LVCAASTPVASAFPWYVVQLEPKPEIRGTGFDLAVSGVAVPQPQSNAAITAAPTASHALRRLRAPRRAPASRAFLLTAQPEQLPPITESKRIATRQLHRLSAAGGRSAVSP
jgi:hypothetical protein